MSDCYYNIKNLKEIGRDICRAILIYYKGIENKIRKNENNSNLSTTSNQNSVKNNNFCEKFNLNSLNPLPKEIEKQRNEIMKDFRTKIEIEIKNNVKEKNEENEESGESDCGPSDDNLDKELLKKLLPAKSKKIKKRKKFSICDSQFDQKLCQLLKDMSDYR